jgi:hypothetical protein
MRREPGPERSLAAMPLTYAALMTALLLTQASASPGERYVVERTAAMQEAATAADVERVLALFAADAVYEHPAFGMRIAGIDAMRAGRLRQLGITRNARVRVRERVALSGVEAISEELTFEARDSDRWRSVTRRQLLVFEYKDGRIARVLEYWEK